MSAPVTVLEIDSDIEEVQQNAFELELAKELQGEEDVGDPEDDSERLPRETDPFPPLPDPAEANLSAESAKSAAKMRQETEKEVAAALAAGEIARAVDIYTLAMRTSGATAAMLASRAAILLKQRRPNASIRDCTAALKINASIVKAYRVRGLAHRKLGHWRKAQRDLNEAQALKFDASTAEVQKFVAAQSIRIEIAQGKRKPGGAPPQRAAPPPKEEKPPPVPPEYLKDLDKGQAVVLTGLQKAPHLNGRRAVVERKDPRPAAQGRWEVETRMDGGVLEIKSLKRENIATLNKLDKAACKAWATAEKLHRQERQKREKAQEEKQYAKCVEAKMSKLGVLDSTKELLRKLKAQDALDVLDKVDGSRVVNINEFLANQARLLTGQDDDSEEESPSKKPRLEEPDAKEGEEAAAA